MSKRKLLLADDSVTIQKVVNLTFADEGIEVISVGDGDSAMEKVAEISPDLIMADVNMPGLTGYEICERIRQNENLRQTPVILLVGSFEPFDEDEARRVGADDYLTKPFQSIRQLVNKVTLLLDAHPAQNGEATALTNEASSLEDTLEMSQEDFAPITQTAGFKDTGYDDEMIQTNRPYGFAFDQTQKFETRQTGELTEPLAYPAREVEVEERLDEPPVSFEKSLVSENVLERITDETDETQAVVENFEDSETLEHEISENVSYEIKDEASDIIEFEEHSESEIKAEELSSELIEAKSVRESELSTPEPQNENFSNEIESNSGVSYELKEETSDEIFHHEEILDEINDQVGDETSLESKEEESTVLTEEEPVLEREELKDEEVSNLENVEYEISDEESHSVEDSNDEISHEGVSDEVIEKDIFSPVEESETDENSQGIKDYAVVSDEFEDQVIKEEKFEELISDDKESVVENEELIAEEAINDEKENIEEMVSDEIIENETEIPETLETENDFAEETADDSEVDQTDLVRKSSDEEIPLPEFASVLEIDDDDLLQLPPMESEGEIPADSETVVENENQSVALISTNENTAVLDPGQISPELIDFIVAKVLERLSEQAIKEVAWEVVPPMTELIVTKMAEEKLK